MQTSSVHVRPATAADAAALAALMTHLGYPTTPERMAARMERIAGRADYVTLVAEVEGAVVGMAGAMRGWSVYQDEPFARLEALVVDPAHQGHGTGAALVRAVEEWARSQGASSLHLTTNNRREGAHRFYARIGFEETGKRFNRRLG